MTKAENRAAAKAYQEEKLRRWREEAHVAAVAADLEQLAGPFLFQDEGTQAEYRAGLKRAIDKGWLKLHESGTFVTLTQSGADLFA